MKSTYKKSGVDKNTKYKLLDSLMPLIASTRRNGWVENIGAFAGFFRADMGRYKNPILVASTDGVGTKLSIAQYANRHDTVGIDLVAMCVNDLICTGAEPLFFLDYLAAGKINPRVMRDVMRGIVKGCKLANVSLIGGETAELPGMYAEGVYDMAGFTVGIVDKERIVDGAKIKAGDLILGIKSSGIHSNGYSMVRKVFAKEELKGRLLDSIMTPTIIYVKPVLDLLKNMELKGIANITGGGFFDNVDRILPKDKIAVIFKKSWQVPEIFTTIQAKGNVKEKEMFGTFNMGIGMTLIVTKQTAWKARRILNDRYKLDSWVIGEIINGKRKVELVDLE